MDYSKMVRSFLVVTLVYGLIIGGAIAAYQPPAFTDGAGKPMVDTSETVPDELADDPGAQTGLAVSLVLYMILGLLLTIALFKYGFDRLFNAAFMFVFIPGSVGFLLAHVLPSQLALLGGPVGLLVGIALYWRPRWGLVNVAAISMGIYSLTYVGSLEIGVFAFVALALLAAVWDHVAVNKIGWMQAAAGEALRTGLPVLLVLPIQRSELSILVEAPMADDVDDPLAEVRDRGATVIGLGDFLLPGFVTMAAAGFATALPALGSIAGTVIGLAVLDIKLYSGGPRVLPGLPVLSTATVLGLLVGGLAAGFTPLETVGLAPAAATVLPG